MRVYDIAHSRTGDKGNISTISACAYRQEDYAVLAEKLTAEKVMEQFAPLGVTHVDRYEIPTLYALNFVIFGSLGGGGNRTVIPFCPSMRGILMTSKNIRRRKLWQRFMH